MRVKGHLSLLGGVIISGFVATSSVHALPESGMILNDLRAALQISPNLSLIEIKFANFDMGTVYTLANTTNVADAPPTTGNGGHPTVAAGIAALDGLGGTTPAVGGIGSEDSWGIARVTSIEDTAANNLYFNGKYGTEMTVMFHSGRDYWVAQSPNGDQLINGVGLQIDVYVDDTPDFTSLLGSGGRGGVASYTNVTDGELVLSLLSIPGHLNDPGENGGNMAEYESRFNSTSSTGQGESWLGVIGGTWMSEFDTDFFGVPLANAGAGFDNADAHAKLETFPVTVSDWLVRSNDPVRVVLRNAIPEPMTAGLGLLALGALATAGTRRQRA